MRTEIDLLCAVCRQGPKGAIMNMPVTKNDSLLAALARSSAVAIVNRHARNVPNRDALVEAIARLALIGLEGHVCLFALRQLECPAGQDAGS